MGWGPVVGDGSGLTDRLQQLLTEGYRVVVAADARRLRPTPSSRYSSTKALISFSFRATLTNCRQVGRSWSRRSNRGVTLPNAKVAIVAGV